MAEAGVKLTDLPLASTYPGRTLVRVAQSAFGSDVTLLIDEAVARHHPNYAEAVLHNALVRMPYLRP